MPIRTSCLMEPIEIKKKALSRFLLTRLAGGGMRFPKHVEHWIRLFVRLSDKAIQEYNQAYELILKEVEESKKFKYNEFFYFHLITNEFENCINTAHRAMKLFKKLTEWNDTPFILQKAVRKSINLLGEKPKRLRNMVEHIDTVVLNGEIEEGKSVILDISEDASMINMGNIQLPMSDLTSLLINLHELALEITIFDVPTNSEQAFKKIEKREKKV